MFKIRLDPFNPNPVTVSQVKLWELDKTLWVIAADSPDPNLEIIGHLDGAMLVNPWGGGAPVLVAVDATEPDTRIYEARFCESIDRHDGNTHKYFLVKWFCRDSDWSDAGETAAMDRASQWIYSEQWATVTPTATG